MFDQFCKIHSGEANAEERHIIVALYMPVGVAVAHGLAVGVQQTLLLYKDRQGYWVYGSEDGVELALLVDGDGRRYLSGRKLDRDEAMRRWMAGFLNWNCESPGIYQLQYSFVEACANDAKESDQ